MEKGHCFMNVDNFEIEYEDFYDFSKSYIGQGCLIDVLKELKAIQEGYPDENGEVLQVERAKSDDILASKGKESSTSFTIVGDASEFSLVSSAKKSESSGFVIVDESEKDPAIEEEKEEKVEEQESDEEWEDIDLED